MATSDESPSLPDRSTWTWDDLLAGRPLLALTVVWLTIAGHAMNFREMGIAHGWVRAELYSLQTGFGVSIALVLLACPALSQYLSARRLAQLGLIKSGNTMRGPAGRYCHFFPNMGTKPPFSGYRRRRRRSGRDGRW